MDTSDVHWGKTISALGIGIFEIFCDFFYLLTPVIVAQNMRNCEATELLIYQRVLGYKGTI